METPKISRKIYIYEKDFDWLDGELSNIDRKINIKVELTVDFIEDKFYIDMNQPFNSETGILMLYMPNMVGNVGRKAKVSAQFYKWIGEICEYADHLLNLEMRINKINI